MTVSVRVVGPPCRPNGSPHVLDPQTHSGPTSLLSGVHSPLRFGVVVGHETCVADIKISTPPFFPTLATRCVLAEDPRRVSSSRRPRTGREVDAE